MPETTFDAESESIEESENMDEYTEMIIQEYRDIEKYLRQRIGAYLYDGVRIDVACHLLAYFRERGVDHHVAQILIHSWNREYCRPPVSDAELSEYCGI